MQSTSAEPGAEAQWLEPRPVNHTLPAGLLSSQEVWQCFTELCECLTCTEHGSAQVACSIQVVDNLYAVVYNRAQEHHHAFFSSEFGGVTTDPAFMVVHMVSRHLRNMPARHPCLAVP